MASGIVASSGGVSIAEARRRFEAGVEARFA